MNHIHQLQQTRIEQATKLVTAAAELRAPLNSPKFGPQADGSRGDGISTPLRRIETLLNILEA